MAAILPRWFEAARRPGRRSPAVVGAAAIGVAALLGLFAFRGIGEAPEALLAPMDHRQRAEEQHCVQGAQLMHDVRWAAACTAAAEEGEGDGMADCDLPPQRAGALYAQLQQAEQTCAAEARTGPR